MIVETTAVDNHPIKCHSPASLVKNPKAIARGYRKVGKVVWCFEMSATNNSQFFLTISASIRDERAWVVWMNGTLRWKNHVYTLTSSQYYYGLRTEFVLTDIVPEFSQWGGMERSVELFYSMNVTTYCCFDSFPEDEHTIRLICQGTDIFYIPDDLPGVVDSLTQGNASQKTIDSIEPWDIVMFLARFHKTKFRINEFTISSILRAASVFKCETLLKKCEEILIRTKSPELSHEDKISYGDQYQFETLLKLCVKQFRHSNHFYGWMMNKGWNLKMSTKRIMFDEAKIVFK
ncbi:unnamed protein product [Caenorhabditis angaria]|uniref:BTB domain-containing protein n=1 Tax=Caenorhabditis angaria TaxID=860376 RepID=A0A9P1J224_9PELO|nr:unnamed protein product [Caenorhabditis angaria]